MEVPFGEYRVDLVLRGLPCRLKQQYGLEDELMTFAREARFSPCLCFAFFRSSRLSLCINTRMWRPDDWNHEWT